MSALPASASPPATPAPPLAASYDYANYFEAGFSRDEILLRFAQAYDGMEALSERARIVMTPNYARALLMLLQDTVARFDALQQAFEHAGDSGRTGGGE